MIAPVPITETPLEKLASRWKDARVAAKGAITQLRTTWSAIGDKSVIDNYNLAYEGNKGLRNQFPHVKVPNFQFHKYDFSNPTWNDTVCQLSGEVKHLPASTTARQMTKVMTAILTVDQAFAGPLGTFYVDAAHKELKAAEDEESECRAPGAQITDAAYMAAAKKTDAVRAMCKREVDQRQNVLDARDDAMKRILTICANYVHGDPLGNKDGSSGNQSTDVCQKRPGRRCAILTWLTGKSHSDPEFKGHEATDGFLSVEALYQSFPDALDAIKAIEGSHMFIGSGMHCIWNGLNPEQKEVVSTHNGFVGSREDWPDKIADSLMDVGDRSKKRKQLDGPHEELGSEMEDEEEPRRVLPRLGVSSLPPSAQRQDSDDSYE